MDKSQIHLGDIKRILLGDAPGAFMPEVLVRTLIVYTVLLFFVRWLGKRMAGQLTITEMSVMIMLGAIVAPAMQIPDRGIMPGLLILLGIVLLQRGITWLSFKKKAVERATQGTTSLLVKDGVLQLDEMRKVRVSQQQIFAILREKEVYNLKKVERLYLEGCGLFSIFKSAEVQPGLCALPDEDDAMKQAMKQAKEEKACGHCGYTLKDPGDTLCPECNNLDWQPAII
ncbi:MAG: YetF domain-containing protein [Bacteroidota bacterium]